MRRRQSVQYRLHGRTLCYIIHDSSGRGFEKIRNNIDFFIGSLDKFVIGGTGLSSQNRFDILTANGYRALARSKEGGERWCVRRNYVVRSANLILALIYTSCVEWNKSKITRRVPMDPWSTTTLGLLLGAYFSTQGVKT
jgi:hypothetical protein